MCIYKIFFNKTKTLKLKSQSSYNGLLNLGGNHFRKLCHLNSKNTRVKIAALITLLSSYQAEIDLNIEYYTCQVPAQYRSLHGRIPKCEMIVVQKHDLTL